MALGFQGAIMLLAEAVVAPLAGSQAVTHGKSSGRGNGRCSRVAHLLVAVVPAARNTSPLPLRLKAGELSCAPVSV